MPIRGPLVGALLEEQWRYTVRVTAQRALQQHQQQESPTKMDVDGEEAAGEAMDDEERLLRHLHAFVVSQQASTTTSTASASSETTDDSSNNKKQKKQKR